MPSAPLKELELRALRQRFIARDRGRQVQAVFKLLKSVKAEELKKLDVRQPRILLSASLEARDPAEVIHFIRYHKGRRDSPWDDIRADGIPLGQALVKRLEEEEAAQARSIVSDLVRALEESERPSKELQEKWFREIHLALARQYLGALSRELVALRRGC